MWWLFLFILSGGLILLIYMYGLAERDHVHVKEQLFPFGEPSQPFHVFFISDIHNRLLKTETLEKIDRVDVVIIGGDLVDKRTPDHRLIDNLAVLKRWNSPLYFIPGNNDHEFKSGSIIKALESQGVRVLSNSSVTEKTDHGFSFTLTGLDPYYLKPSRSSSYKDEGGTFQMLCVHDPFVFDRMNDDDKQRYDLVLNGHTHGGQIRIFGFGPYQRGGWMTTGRCRQLVSEGYGTSVIPLRLGTRAECHLIKIRPHT